MKKVRGRQGRPGPENKMASGFIDHEKIFSFLANARPPDRKETADILAKARQLKGIDFAEAAKLLLLENEEDLAALFEAALFVKSEIYGKRLVLFAPLYVSNLCNNECLYCAFRKSNQQITRRTLGLEEIRRETEMLVEQGHKRLLLVSGEGLGQAALDYSLKAIETIYSVKRGNGEIRRININIAALDVEGFRRLKAAGIGTYQLFQETYHLPTFRRMHPSGPKADYLFHLTAMDRAMQGGIDDVGVGVLFGLYDFRFEVLAMLQHIRHLEENFGVGCHTISLPRLEPANGSDISLHPPYPVTDADFRKIIAVLRLTVPYTGMILSTRENAAMRREAFSLGISQISAGSRTNPGGYSRQESGEQFSLGDHRNFGRGHPGHRPLRLRSFFLHRLLPPGPHRRRFHGPGQAGTDQVVLPAQRLDLVQGIPGQLCRRRRPARPARRSSPACWTTSLTKRPGPPRRRISARSKPVPRIFICNGYRREVAETFSKPQPGRPALFPAQSGRGRMRKNVCACRPYPP